MFPYSEPPQGFWPCGVVLYCARFRQTDYRAPPAPYRETQAPSAIPKPSVSPGELEAERWQHDFWYGIVEAALGATPEQVRLDDLPGVWETRGESLRGHHPQAA